MNRGDQDFLEHLSDQNMRHMREQEQVENLFEWYLESYDATKLGAKCAAMINGLTIYMKIRILGIAARDMIGKLPQGLHCEIRDLVGSIDREGFRTAEDY